MKTISILRIAEMKTLRGIAGYTLLDIREECYNKTLLSGDDNADEHGTKYTTIMYFDTKAILQP